MLTKDKRKKNWGKKKEKEKVPWEKEKVVTQFSEPSVFSSTKAIHNICTQKTTPIKMWLSALLAW